LKKQLLEMHLSNKYLIDRRKHSLENKDKHQKVKTKDADLKKI
jgi:hypothetical protein